MRNPWEEISLSDYENHMSLDSVRQLQSLNRIMKSQLSDFDVTTVMILGIAGGNGLEHISPEKYRKVYGVDINEAYLQVVAERYAYLSETLECLNIDIINESDKLPTAELIIANLLIEYVGYKAFSNAVMKVRPLYVSCVIQINEKTEQWVSDSPYIHSFDGLDSIHCQVDESTLTKVMKVIGYRLVKSYVEKLPNGKRFLRLDFVS